ncbi:MAG: membrane protein insertion efficiency factor YidD [Candidatus Electryonea clarkiae]|nr:membrane protein insertion efficiency factor YidD [Candidatus Electryonea clarkiae]MDP8288957.1 membrane protein insertion efficiency factor YidD [Candidatus Electryonea clarkiae]
MIQAGTTFVKLNRLLSLWMIIPLIRIYHIIGSPVFAMLGSKCRFYPTCSHYAEDALRSHGLFRGLWLFAIRFAKCNPLHPGGYDPVPPAKEFQ